MPQWSWKDKKVQRASEVVCRSDERTTGKGDGGWAIDRVLIPVRDNPAAGRRHCLGRDPELGKEEQITLLGPVPRNSARLTLP